MSGRPLLVTPGCEPLGMISDSPLKGASAKMIQRVFQHITTGAISLPVKGCECEQEHKPVYSVPIPVCWFQSNTNGNCIARNARQTIHSCPARRAYQDTRQKQEPKQRQPSFS